MKRGQGDRWRRAIGGCRPSRGAGPQRGLRAERDHLNVDAVACQLFSLRAVCRDYGPAGIAAEAGVRRHGANQSIGCGWSQGCPRFKHKARRFFPGDGFKVGCVIVVDQVNRLQRHAARVGQGITHVDSCAGSDIDRDAARRRADAWRRAHCFDKGGIQSGDRSVLGVRAADLQRRQCADEQQEATDDCPAQSAEMSSCLLEDACLLEDGGIRMYVQPAPFGPFRCGRA